MYKYAIIGFGGLGKTHLANLISLSQQRHDIELCAICGADKNSIHSNVKLNLGEVDMSSVNLDNCNFYMDYKELFEKESLDFAICTLPTYLHEEVAIYAMSKGVHVFSEKPMALTHDGCRNMAEASLKYGKKLMIGHCTRFDAAYRKIKEYIDSKVFGKVLSARFNRYSQIPLWSWDNWVLDPKRSGGCVLDMHIHDVDLINWFFGMPNSVSTVAGGKDGNMDSVSSHYFYNDFFVTAEADWLMAQTFPFNAGCILNFENAVVRLADGKLTVYTNEEAFCPEISDKHFFLAEMEAFLNYVIDDVECPDASLDSVCQTMEIVFTEIEAAKKGTSICF